MAAGVLAFHIRGCLSRVPAFASVTLCMPDYSVSLKRCYKEHRIVVEETPKITECQVLHSEHEATGTSLTETNA